MLHAEKLSEPLVRTDVYLSAFQRDSMKDLARHEDISMAELIRRVINKHIRRVMAKSEGQRS